VEVGGWRCLTSLVSRPSRPSGVHIHIITITHRSLGLGLIGFTRACMMLMCWHLPAACCATADPLCSTGWLGLGRLGLGLRGYSSSKKKKQTAG